MRRTCPKKKLTVICSTRETSATFAMLPVLCFVKKRQQFNTILLMDTWMKKEVLLPKMYLSICQESVRDHHIDFTFTGGTFSP